jgi:hypothetical protein
MPWFKLRTSWRNDLAIRGLTPTQRGILIDLKCHVAEFGELPRDIGPLVKLAGGRPDRDQAPLEAYFNRDPDTGLLFDAELEGEREHMCDVSRTRREAAEARWGNTVTPAVGEEAAAREREEIRRRRLGQP